jgi:DNA-binding Lrp family transcriptional regulator
MCFQLCPGLSTSPEENFSMDRLDRKIFAELQQDGRLTLTELAERVGLSV